MNLNARIYIAGHRGLVGSALMRNLQQKGYTNLITRTHAELDLTDQAAVDQFFCKLQPEYVFLASSAKRFRAAVRRRCMGRLAAD